MNPEKEVGPVRDMPLEQVVEAAKMIKTGTNYSLSVPRFTGMPLFPGHPPFQVVNYRTPPGIIAGGVEPWGPPNEVNLGYMAEYLMACSHSGAHIDGLAHMTIGDDNHWYGGGNTTDHMTDHGPNFGDASKLPAFFTRGVLLDPPTYRGVDALPAHEPVSADELKAVAESQGVEIRPWDVVLIRTGYLKYWPDREKMNEHLTAGPDLSAAEWLLESGVIATGTDTETYEVMPTPDRGSPANPQPVHTKLLIENGIYLLESIYLEEIAREKVYEFAFIMLPLKIQGATGSMVDPLAVI